MKQCSIVLIVKLKTELELKKLRWQISLFQAQTNLCRVLTLLAILMLKGLN